MGREISQESTHNAASEALDRLTLVLFQHSINSEEAYFVAEMARGVESSIASKVFIYALRPLRGLIAPKFVNNGLLCIAKILNEAYVTPQPEALAECIRRAGELLRVLIHVTEPLREEAFELPELDCGIQEGFFDAICTKFEDIRSMFNGGSFTDDGLSQVTRSAIFLGRLLQFDLGFRGVWTAKTREGSGSLSSTLFRLALVCELVSRH
jgi:mediator of RNA polymerase II transcription subunit 12